MDMLVSLYNVPDHSVRRAELERGGIRFVRAMAGDGTVLRNFIATAFPQATSWVDEASAALSRQPEASFLAVKEDQIIGFSCYDATAKGMVGPVGVSNAHRGNGIASVLLSCCFSAMRDTGYAYAVIGWVSSPSFYQKSCGAVPIENSFPGVYGRKVVCPKRGIG